jgi:hypothetical protein
MGSQDPVETFCRFFERGVAMGVEKMGRVGGGRGDGGLVEAVAAVAKNKK